LKEVYPLFKHIAWNQIKRFFVYWGWLRLIIRITFFVSIFIIGYYTAKFIMKPFEEYIKPTPQITEIYVHDLKSFDLLILAVGKKESSNNWKAVNGQYIGYFQFGNSAFAARRKIGLDINLLGVDNFLKNKELQVVYFKEYMMLVH
jgi:uncharacterized protein YneF (UPF0154 family)